MMYLNTSLFIFFGVFSFAENRLEKPRIPKGSYAIFENEKYRVFTPQKNEGLLFLDCKSNCDAKNALKGKYEFPKAPHPDMQNPAAQYCGNAGGKNLIALNDHGGEENFCKFTDGSYINSWDLFYKRFPKAP